MVPAGYMAKRVQKRPDWLEASNVLDIYSVSGCISEEFADYVPYWQHNGYWLFDSSEVIRRIAHDHSIELEGLSLFFYEVYEMEFDGKIWQVYSAEPSFPTNVETPSKKRFQGVDVVTFLAGNRPECSPLSCNSLAKKLHTNEHCLFSSFEEAKMHLDGGAFNKCEPGPYRIFSVNSVDWP